MNRRSFGQVALSLALAGVAACGGAAPPAAEPTAARRPSDVYTEYVTAIGNAGTLKEVAPYLSAAAQRRIGGDLETLKTRVPGGVLKIDDEKIEADRATVRISATIPKGGKEVPATGMVLLVREGGRWKVDQESWTPN